MTGADGLARTRAERGHGRVIVTTLGQVRVARIAYRAGVKGVPALFPLDAALNLPPRKYSWQLQQLAGAGRLPGDQSGEVSQRVA